MKIKHKLELSFKEYLRSYTKNMKKTLQQFWPNNKIVVLKKLLNSSSGHAVCVCVCVCVCDRRGEEEGEPLYFRTI